MNIFLHSKAGNLLCLAAVTFFSTLAYSQTDFNLTVGSATQKMVFVEGGTFQMGCGTGSSCGPNESPVRSVTLDNYYIGETEVTNALWRAVMNDNTTSNNNPKTSVDWYHAVDFVCKLNQQQTGKKYRLATEAEWEFAARGGKKSNNTRWSGSATASTVAVVGSSGWNPSAVKTKAANELGLYDMSGNVREWVYDAWNQAYPSAAQTNPTGAPIIHIQKIRRGGGFMTSADEATVYSRKIRSIEGADGDLGFRLAISNSQNTIPSGMVDACEIHRPPVSHGKNTMRDDRLITGSDYVWVQEMVYNNQTYTSALKIWDDGTAVMRNFMGQTVSGEWATGNDFSLYIMTSNGTRNKYIYYVVSPKMEITLMPSNDMPNRWEYKPAADVNVSITKPSVGSKTPEQIVPAGSVVNMDNPPTTGKDSRLPLSGQSWVQDNVALGAGGTHRYRFDYSWDAGDTARFVVWDPGMNTSVIISSGKWFTIDNTFLRIIDKDNGKKYDYLYSVVGDTVHYHISFQGYERGDFRMFKKMNSSSVPNWITPTMRPYQTQSNGGSTYLSPSEVAGLPPVSSSSQSSSSVAQSSSSSQLSSSSAAQSSSSSQLSSSSAAQSSSSVNASSSSSPLICSMTATTGIVGEQFAATANCNGAPLNTLIWDPVDRIPTEAGNITVKVTRPAGSASVCAGMTVECGIIIVSDPNSPSSSSSDDNSSSSAMTTPITHPKIPSGPIFAYAAKGAIMLGNVPHGAKVQLYNIHGEQIYSANHVNPQILKIEVQAKGMYFVKVNGQTLQIPVM